MFSVGDYLENWFRTVRNVVRRPRKFFSEMPASEGWKEPLGFAALAIFILSLFSAIALPIIFFPKGTLAWLASPSLNHKVLISILLLGAIFLYSFFSTLISLAVSSGINHILLKICGARGDFRQTFRVSCYYMAVSVLLMPAAYFFVALLFAINAAGLESMLFTLLSIFVLLPILAIVAYSFYILFVGFSLVHDISMKRVTLAIIGIPSAAVLILVIFAVSMAFIFGSLSSTPPYNQPDMHPNITAPYGSTPLIDGSYTSEDKWDEAVPVAFTSKGIDYTVAAKHDGLVLYILIMWSGGKEWENSVSIFLEQDGTTHDHDLRTGLNDEKYNGAVQYGPGSFADAHYGGGVMETKDGMVRGNYSQGVWVQEWAVPLRSGDPNDVNVEQFPSNLGFAIIPWYFKSNAAAWPSGNAQQYEPETWGDLKLLAQ